MHKQFGSIILILVIVIISVSLTSVVVLQTNTSFKKQINLADLLLHANKIFITSIDTRIASLSSGINFDNLPINESSVYQIGNQQFTYTQLIDSILTIDVPLTGYSLKGPYSTTMVELQTKVTAPTITTVNQHYGLGCLDIGSNTISNQIEPSYSLDLDQDFVTDVIYQFDSTHGQIWKTGNNTKLLIELDFDTDQSFSRPDFVLINFGLISKLAIIFVVQNVGPVSFTAGNTLYILIDNGLVGPAQALPLEDSQIVDLQTNPVFSASDQGYFLNLDQGQLISSGLTTINQQLLVITQSPATNPNTGSIEYQNKLHSINLQNGSAISVSAHTISPSPDLLELQLSTSSYQIITLISQYGSLMTLIGECRRLYQYEDYGL